MNQNLASKSFKTRQIPDGNLKWWKQSIFAYEDNETESEQSNSSLKIIWRATGERLYPSLYSIRREQKVASFKKPPPDDNGFQRTFYKKNKNTSIRKRAGKEEDFDFSKPVTNNILSRLEPPCLLNNYNNKISRSEEAIMNFAEKLLNISSHVSIKIQEYPNSSNLATNNFIYKTKLANNFGRFSESDKKNCIYENLQIEQKYLSGRNEDNGGKIMNKCGKGNIDFLAWEKQNNFGRLYGGSDDCTDHAANNSSSFTVNFEVDENGMPCVCKIHIEQFIDMLKEVQEKRTNIENHKQMPKGNKVKENPKMHDKPVLPNPFRPEGTTIMLMPKHVTVPAAWRKPAREE